MAVICISREMAANGEETARELAATGGYRFIERANIEAHLSRYNLSREDLVKYDEKKPGFWAALSENRDLYIHYLNDAVCSEAAGGDCVILGRGGSPVLRNVPGVIHILLVAPPAVRVARLARAFGCDERGAEQQIKQSDHDRQGFHKYFFDVDWQNPASYHLTINTGSVSIQDAAKTIEQFRRIEATAEKEAAGKARLGEMRLQNAIAGEILYTRHIKIQELGVVVRGTDVTLTGCSLSQVSADSAFEAAAGVSGVGKVTNNIMAVPPVPPGAGG